MTTYRRTTTILIGPPQVAQTVLLQIDGDSLGTRDTHITLTPGNPGGIIFMTLNEPSPSFPHIIKDTSVTLTPIGPPGPDPEPTATQLLGLSPMPSGFGPRTQYIASSHLSSPTDSLQSVDRARGTMPNDETIDMRGVKVWTYAGNKAGINVNNTGNAPDTNCSRWPAIIGSLPSTPKAQVGRIWGLDHFVLKSDGTTQWRPVPANDPVKISPFNGQPNDVWERWKSISPGWRQGDPGYVVDGVGDPWEAKTMWADCKPGDRVFIDGMWFRHQQDGPSSFGSTLEMRNSLIQFNHDDTHEQDRNYGPVIGYKNLYYDCFMGVSYRPDTGNGPDRSAERTTFDGCLWYFSRALGERFAGNLYDWDHHAHGKLYKYLGGSGPSGSNAPTPHYANCTVLMLAPAAQDDLAGLCLPAGSTASNCHFVYITLGQGPSTLPQSNFSQGKNSISYEQAGWNVHIGADTNYSGINTYWKPAVDQWLSDHPQYGLTYTTLDGT